MPRVRTKHFETVDYDDGAVLTFPSGLPAFDEERRFVLLEQPATAPVVFVQSLDSEGLCLPAVPVRAIDPHYQLELAAEDLRALQAESLQQLLADQALACLAVIAVRDTGAVTANLAAPIVVNLRTNRAVQSIRADARYSFAHPVVPDQAGAAPCL